ncbi:MAG: GrpB family protein [Alphaproteobacteria bacterium]|nr:GrpB family protein [Alphaproteobacteria bacterium]MBV9694689.1 GrpB family protein [Alphaproteobacteria bacterium]
MPIDTPEPYAVELHAHSPRWAEMAQEESRRLKDALGDLLVRVHHIGSTSIPGIMAKPIVDLIPIVGDIHGLDAQEKTMRALGYRWYGEYGLPGRRYCTLNDPATGKRLFQLHCYRDGDPAVLRHLAFRDYLRAFPLLAKEYEMEKIRAASVRSDDVNAYNDEKNAWIKRVEKKALAWAAKSSHT